MNFFEGGGIQNMHFMPVSYAVQRRYCFRVSAAC